MKLQVMWSQWSAPGLEHLCLTDRGDEITADGIILGVENGEAFRLHYQIICDSQWRVRKVKAGLLNENRNIFLTSDGSGSWLDEFSRPISALDGCIDVDITATPFTNTLPIRRLNLKKGQSAELKVVYIIIPEMQIIIDRQCYTCLEISSAGSRYKFESLDSDFTADLPIDTDGLVKDYPELFRRVWSIGQLVIGI